MLFSGAGRSTKKNNPGIIDRFYVVHVIINNYCLPSGKMIRYDLLKSRGIPVSGFLMVPDLILPERVPQYVSVSMFSL